MKCPHHYNILLNATNKKIFWKWCCTCSEYHIMSKFWSIKLFLTSQSLPFDVISNRKKEWQFLYAFQIRKIGRCCWVTKISLAILKNMQINVGYMSTFAILCSLRLLLDGSLLAKISMNNAWNFLFNSGFSFPNVKIL